MSRTFKLTIAYDGTEFAGWQVQPGQPTIQAALQSALASLTPGPIRLIGSGRTDAGVHALAQVASCTLPAWRAPAEALRRALNTGLPPTICVLHVEEAAPGFHALRDATRKRYRYQIRVGGLPDPFGYRYHWHLRGPLDVTAMRSAAWRLVGRHDFASFEATGSPRQSTVRHVRSCEVIESPLRQAPSAGFELPPDAGGAGRGLAVEVEADGFLYNMVRNIVGTLVEIGRRRQPAEWIEEVLALKNRDAAGPTAPPQGLFLKRVDYE